mgnify:CR=1 FL=1
MLDRTAIDIGAILASLPPAKPVGAFDRWLAEDPDRTERFWMLIDAGQARGHGLGPLIEAWNAATGEPIPVKQNQVRVKLRERTERAGQKRG